jgi:hypothetical protein
MTRTKNNGKLSAGWKYILPGFIASVCLMVGATCIQAQQEAVFKISAVKPTLYPEQETLKWGVNNYFRIRGLKGTKIDSISFYRGKVISRDSSLTLVPVHGNTATLKLFIRKNGNTYKCIFYKQYKITPVSNAAQ